MPLLLLHPGVPDPLLPDQRVCAFEPLSRSNDCSEVAKGGQSCGENKPCLFGDALLAVSEPLFGLSPERKRQLDAARHRFVMGLIGQDNVAPAVCDADRDRVKRHQDRWARISARWCASSRSMRLASHRASTLEPNDPIVTHDVFAPDRFPVRLDLDRPCVRHGPDAPQCVRVGMETSVRSLGSADLGISLPVGAALPNPGRHPLRRCGLLRPAVIERTVTIGSPA
jgi:hypothetical protein